MSHTKNNLAEKSIYLLRQFLMIIILPSLILFGCFKYAQHLKDTGPKTERKARQYNARLVDVQKMSLTDQAIVVHAMGTVIPAQQISLTPQISGKIEQLNPQLEPGGFLKQDQTILKIEDTDYKLAKLLRQAELDQVQADYRIEQGQQAIAKREYELLGQDINEQDRDLILRKPQLQIVAAQLEAAKSKLDQAELDLKRTTIKAPFNAIVLERNINIGSHVTTGSTLANLVGTDVYWIKISVPVDQLKWIHIPNAINPQGSNVRIFNETAWGKTFHRIGQVIRLAGNLEAQGRMAQLIVAVKNPLTYLDNGKMTPPLLLDSYVRVEINGSTLKNIFKIPRDIIQHDNTIFVYKDQKLDIRPVMIVHRGPDHVYVQSGLNNQEWIITTKIDAPIQDMPLRTKQAKLAIIPDKTAQNAATQAKTLEQ